MLVVKLETQQEEKVAAPHAIAYTITESDIKCSGTSDLSGSDRDMVYKHYCHLILAFIFRVETVKLLSL